MDWTALEWTAPGAEDDSLTAFLATHAPLIRSALDEAAAAAILGPATIVSIETAVCSVTELPDGLIPIATFELLGTSRRAVGAALDPTLGSELGGTAVSVEGMGRGLLDAVDEVLGALVGEGLNLGEADALPSDDELLLVRLAMASGTDPDAGPELAVVVAVARAAQGELATHIRALETLGAAPAGGPQIDPDDGGPMLSVAAPEAGPPGHDEPTPAPESAGVAPAVVEDPAPVPPGGDGSHLAPSATPIRPAQFPPLSAGSVPAGRQSLDLLLGVNLEVTVEIGRARMMIRDVLALTPGSIVELDKLAGEKVDVLVNRHHVATGEVVVVDENFGVRITEIVARDRRLTPIEGRA